MKPPPFTYFRAASAEEAVNALVEHADVGVRLIAGGQSLLPMMFRRLAVPSILVDIGRVENLSSWEIVDGSLRIGATVRLRDLELDRNLSDAFPLLRAVLAHVSHPEIRNRSTVGGSIAHADPAAELPALLLALDGHVEVTGPQETRYVSACEFFLGPYTTILSANEMITHIVLPLPEANVGWAVQEFAKRRGDFALAGVIAILATDDRICRKANVTLFGLGGKASRALTCEEILLGNPIVAEVIENATAEAINTDEILGDIHGSRRFRSQLASVLLRRALTAIARSMQNAP